MLTLKYVDEQDRAYGLSGMVVCMNAMDSERYIDFISLDNEADHGMGFTPDFFHIRNQELSPKAVWNDNLNHFQLVTGLLVSNMLSRALLRHHAAVGREMADTLLSRVADEGKELCSLEDDEISTLFTKTFSYFHRLFEAEVTAQVVDRMVGLLTERRRLEAEDILAVLRPMRSRW